MEDCKVLSELLNALPEDVRAGLIQKFTDEANGAARACKAMTTK